jgi:hypothetical protein
MEAPAMEAAAMEPPAMETAAPAMCRFGGYRLGECQDAD